MSKTYIVNIPIAGHVSFEVEAENEEAAIALAWDQDPSSGKFTGEMLDSFGRVNVCHCPQPWQVTAEEQ
jgi:hypothetical protein